METQRALVEVEPDNAEYQLYLWICLQRLGKHLIELQQPHADVIREAWRYYMTAELLEARHGPESQMRTWGAGVRRALGLCMK